jgi:hypothetical protein
MQSKEPKNSRWGHTGRQFPTGSLFWVDKTNDIRVVQPCSKCGKPVLVPWVVRPLPSVKCGNCSS